MDNEHIYGANTMYAVIIYYTVLKTVKMSFNL